MKKIFHPDGYAFQITKVIQQRGKFNAVYLAIDEKNDRFVIVKKLNEPLSVQAIAQFKKELTWQISHPNMVQALDYFAIQNEHYLIREYVDGKDSKAYLKSKRFTPEEAVYCAKQILEALSALHEHQIYHCDIRPANIIIHQNTILTNHVKLLDLGLAKSKDETATHKPFALIYSAPEQILQHTNLINASTDLYALGVTMHEWLTGKPPYYHTNPELLMNVQLTQPLSKSKYIPDSLFQLLTKATAKALFAKPPRMYTNMQVHEMLSQAQSQRFQTAKTFLNELNNVAFDKNAQQSWRKYFGF